MVEDELENSGSSVSQPATTSQPPAGSVAASQDHTEAGGVSVSSLPVSGSGMDQYERLQRRLLVATAIAIAIAVPICGLLSMLLGGMGGLLYLRLLARSVSRLGGDRRSVGKLQLLVPVVIVLASSRISELELLPALLGFLLYKPALIIQAILDR
jgi:ATP synthase protein I